MEISLTKLISMLLKQWKLIVAFLMAGFLAALVITTVLIKPTYQATAKMNVFTDDSQSSQVASSANVNDLNYVRQIIATYVEFLKTHEFQEEVSALLNNEYTPAQIKSMVAFTTSNETMNVNVVVTADSKEAAYKVANAVVQNIPVRISKVLKDSNNTKMTVAESPVMPRGKASPNTALNCIIGFLVGGVIAVVIVLLKEMLDVRIKGEDDLLERYNIPVLGSVPDFDPERKKKKGGLGRA